MSKLSTAQAALLSDMRHGGTKSGAFWAGLGNPIQSLVSLERRGLIEIVTHGPTNLRTVFRITDAGRAALENPDGL